MPCRLRRGAGPATCMHAMYRPSYGHAQEGTRLVLVLEYASCGDLAHMWKSIGHKVTEGHIVRQIMAPMLRVRQRIYVHHASRMFSGRIWQPQPHASQPHAHAAACAARSWEDPRRAASLPCSCVHAESASSHTMIGSSAISSRPKWLAEATTSLLPINASLR